MLVIALRSRLVFRCYKSDYDWLASFEARIHVNQSIIVDTAQTDNPLKAQASLGNLVLGRAEQEGEVLIPLDVWQNFTCKMSGNINNVNKRYSLHWTVAV